MKRSWIFAGFAALAAAACSDNLTPLPDDPLLANQVTAPGPGTERYIVRFRDSEPNDVAQADRLVQRHRGRLVYRYRNAIKGFAGDFTSQEVAALRQDPDVMMVEQDQLMYAIATQPNPPSWGLDRIDQNALPLSASYTFNSTGAGVRVYIIDTGILFSHNDFGGRASTGVDQITPGGTAADCHGHGTHVAGTVGGSTYGVAKAVTLYAVRVLACSGSGPTSGVIAGVDWVTGQKLANPSIPAVANMSLGGGFSPAMNAAVTNSINAGVTYAVAAGNSNADACSQSPAATPAALTVGATTISDARSSFSNFGTCLDIFAPGSAITSAWIGSNTATNTINGTSMASPHVAGAAALYLQLNPSATPAAVGNALIGNATLNVVTNPGPGSPNRLLYMGFINPIPAPVANFTWACPTLTCTFDANGTTAQPNATYTWLWGDGSRPFGTGKTPTHTYAQAWGPVNVSLVVVDAGGSSIVTQTIQVPQAPPPPPPPPPVADFTWSCAGLTCSFDASPTVAQPNATFTWLWGDGTRPFGTGKTASHTYSAPWGPVSVSLVVIDAGGSNIATKTIQVTVP